MSAIAEYVEATPIACLFFWLSDLIQVLFLIVIFGFGPRLLTMSQYQSPSPPTSGAQVESTGQVTNESSVDMLIHGFGDLRVDSNQDQKEVSDSYLE